MEIKANFMRGYPKQVRSDIKVICDRIKEVCGENLEAIVLTGSAANKELSYFFKNKDIEILSDYEFLVILKKSSMIQRMRLLNKIMDGLEEISKKYVNPLFHIDVALMNKANAEKLKKDLWAFELKTSGEVLVGDEEILDTFPTVTPEKIDTRDFLELLMKRIHEILLFVPKEFVEKGTASGEMRNLIFSYALCRNLLVIPSALLPMEGILERGLRARCTYVCKHFRKLKLSKHLGPEFPDLLKECTRFKLNPKYGIKWDVKDLYFKTMNYFMKSFCYIFNTHEEGVFEFLAKDKFFEEFSLKSKLNCIRKMKNFKIILKKNLKNRLLLIYLFLHLALMNRLSKNHRKSKFYLTKAKNVLINFLHVKTQGEFIEDWFSLNEKVDLITIGLFMVGPSLERLTLNARRWARWLT